MENKTVFKEICPFTLIPKLLCHHCVHGKTRTVKAAKKAFVDLERFSTGFTTINTRRIGNAPGKYPTKHKLMSKHYEK